MTDRLDETGFTAGHNPWAIALTVKSTTLVM